MTDGIIKGTGNSRYLKTVANALTLYPTHEAFIEALAAGTFPVDLNGINPSGWDVQGDKLNKATLLTDALCTALGLAATATPTQAMEKLRQLVNSLDTAKARIATGKYAGNGNYGSDSGDKQFISLPFNPNAVLVANEGVFTDHTFNSDSVSSGICLTNFNVKMSYRSTTIPGLWLSGYGFYVNSQTIHSTSARVRFNDINTTYVYLAIG